MPRTPGKRDIARAAATVLTQEGHSCATYFPTVPETLNMTDAAAKLSQVTGRKVCYLNLPSPVFHTIPRLTGSSRWMANGLVAQFSDMVAGQYDIDPTCEIERLTSSRQRTSRASYAIIAMHSPRLLERELWT